MFDTSVFRILSGVAAQRWTSKGVIKENNHQTELTERFCQNNNKNVFVIRYCANVALAVFTRKLDQFSRSVISTGKTYIVEKRPSVMLGVAHMKYCENTGNGENNTRGVYPTINGNRMKFHSHTMARVKCLGISLHV